MCDCILNLTKHVIFYPDTEMSSAVNVERQVDVSDQFRAVTLISPESVEQKDFAVVTQPKQTSTIPGSTQAQALTTDIAKDSSTLVKALQKSKPDNSRPGLEASSVPETGTSHDSNVSEVKYIPAVFVFGGMDTSGHIHSDSFILCPTLTDTY